MPQAVYKPKTENLEEPQTEIKTPQPIIVDVSDNYSQSTLITLKEALNIAESLGQEQVSPLHLLKALTSSSSLKPIFSNLNVSPVTLSSAVSEFTPKSTAKPNIVIFSPSLKKLLLAAFLIAQKGNSQKVENLHLFYAAISSPETAPALSKINLNLAKLEEFMGQNSAPPDTPSLNRVSQDLTIKSLKTPSIIIGRGKELEIITRILIQRGKPNILLLGEHGVGKTTLVESLAQNLNKNNITALRNSRVKMLDIETLFSSSENLNRLGPQIIDEASSANNKLILVFDKISFLQNPSQVQALITFLSHLLKNEKISIILISDPTFYNEYLKNNSLINNYFEKITVEEPSLETAIEIAREKALSLESFHHVKFDPKSIETAVTLSKRFIITSVLPQKAIDILEEAAAQKSLKKESLVTDTDIKILLSEKTGIPLGQITTSEKEKLTNLESILEGSVVGQEEAVKKVSEAIRRSRAGLKDNKKPIGSFLFLGPTGVGKTELAKTLAKTIFNDEKAFVRLDMSEYSEPHTTQRLIGSPPGYVGYEEGGQLTNPVLEKPYCLILLDEIEKANPKIFDIFLQVLDDGRLTDARGQTADFKNTIIIATSNIASDQLLNLSPQEVKSFNILPELLKNFRPEFINRFDEIVVFNPLTEKELVQIARLKIKDLENRLKEKNIHLEVTDSKLEQLVKESYDPSFGARPLERMIREKLENPIAKKLIDGSLLPGSTVKWD